MSTQLDLADIQGNILRAYGKQKFPKARYLFLHFMEGPLHAARARAFVEGLRGDITTAIRWQEELTEEAKITARAAAAGGRRPRVSAAIKAHVEKDYPGDLTARRPMVAINIAFTFMGLLMLEVPTRTLQSLPQEFIDGMSRRATTLGDPEEGAIADPERGIAADNRDDIWKRSHGGLRVHAMIALNAQMEQLTGETVPELEAQTQRLIALKDASGGSVILLEGHRGASPRWQDASALIEFNPNGFDADGKARYRPKAKEHFGFADGLGDPVFEGQYTPAAMALRKIGGGKIEPGPERKWAPLATGEFLLGYPDEAQEIPDAAIPIEFSRNGTFMAFRKLHQNVGTFKDHIAGQAPGFGRAAGIGDPIEAAALLMAKMAGRWCDGEPLARAPDHAARERFRAEMKQAQETQNSGIIAKAALKYVDFDYRGDLDGAACPLGSHLRRANPRDALGPTGDFDGSVLTNRRRILRRGLPYGAEVADDGSEHGVIFMAVCASLFRQFEFVQQQWIQYGLDFDAGNDTCPMLGNHGRSSKFVVPAKPDGTAQPFISGPLPQFVECRGGDYFFIPSMTALRLIGAGIIDPT